ncbi:MAG: hypothetical protein K2X38_11940 [Gemmataceae bacterium]|nr:hypothetical protein [Gemmataceae bacterium]
MLRRAVAAFLLAIFVALPASAQSPWRYKWEKGQVFTYKTQHVTSVVETLEKSKVEIGSRLTLSKRWVVTDVDAQGNATLEMSLVAMRNEQTRPNGEKLLFDSENVPNSTPALQGMAKFIGKPLHSVKLNPLGQAIEAKEDVKAKFDAEPPFVVVVPDSAVPQEGQSWSRPFAIADPAGGDEKIQFVQKFVCVKNGDGKATLQLTNELKSDVKMPADRILLLQRETTGEATFDIERGITLSVQLAADRKVENHQGAGTSYRYMSTFAEELVPNADPKIVPAGN